MGGGHDRRGRAQEARIVLGHVLRALIERQALAAES
jgi:hypothetical protein